MTFSFKKHLVFPMEIHKLKCMATEVLQVCSISREYFFPYLLVQNFVQDMGILPENISSSYPESRDFC